MGIAGKWVMAVDRDSTVTSQRVPRFAAPIRRALGIVVRCALLGTLIAWAVWLIAEAIFAALGVSARF